MRRMLAALACAGLAAACSVPAPPLPEPPALPAARAPSPRPAATVPAVPDAVSQKVIRDTVILRRRTQAFIAPPSAPLDKVATLADLTRDINKALAVMELHHTRAGYRPADVRAARKAANAAAAFLAAQPVPPAPAEALPVEGTSDAQ